MKIKGFLIRIVALFSVCKGAPQMPGVGMAGLLGSVLPLRARVAAGVGAGAGVGGGAAQAGLGAGVTAGMNIGAGLGAMIGR
ncbi:fibroin heavy chain-like isoform X2 [Argiope bruennichi]|uniref:fibroin heavy chain-like isoform X2 n=1 Tax=Argiope bruennichi TaxID=94029 RepID=UPI002493FEE4|nr:fibroin heavy chain-like isoform X2 [Argiope bruennichi]